MSRSRLAAAASLLAVFGSLATAPTARADVAPPPAAPGAALAPQAETRVRMVAERVVLTVDSREPDGGGAGLASDTMGGTVEAAFTMRNDGDAPETMAVRFPLWRDAYEVALPDGFTAEVDGAAVGVATVDGRGTPIAAGSAVDGDRPEQGWASFPVTFAPGADTRVVVRYRVAPTGYPPYGTFHYVLDTGAAWAGVIGDAEVIVRLPYPVDKANVALDADSMWDTGPRPAGFAVEGSDVVWRFTDLEPTEADNIRLTVLDPAVRQAIGVARATAANEPASVQAWRALGVALDAALYTSRDVGVVAVADSDALAAEARGAFDRALARAPDDVETLVAYALHLDGAAGVLFYGDFEPRTRAVIDRALAAAPDDPRLAALASMRDDHLHVAPTWTADAATAAAATALGAPADAGATPAAPSSDAAGALDVPVAPDDAPGGALPIASTTVGLGALAAIVAALAVLLPLRRRRGR